MYLFWFGDDTVFSGLTFYMTARFFNAEDGTITRFINKDLTVNNSGLVNGERVGLKANPVRFYEINFSNTIDDVDDLYYQVVFKRSDHTYKITRGITSNCDFVNGTSVKL
jgi:hypothetical protein